MTRVRTIENESDLSPEDRYIYKEIADTRGAIRGLFAVLLNSPEVAARTAHLGAYLRFGSVLPDGIRELGIITAAIEMNCNYEWSTHVKLAMAAGIQTHVIETVRQRKPLDHLPSDQRLVIDFGRQLIQTKRVNEETYHNALEKFGTKGITDLISTFGYYLMIACVLNAFDVQPEEGSPSIE